MARSENTRSRGFPATLPGVLVGDGGTPDDAAAIGGDSEQNLHPVEVQHARIGAPAAPHEVTDCPTLRRG